MKPRSPARFRAAAIASLLFAPELVAGQDSELEFESSTPEIMLAATITAPPSRAPTTLAVLVSVAGPADRDLTLGSHRYFRRLADGLAEGGVATLRFDDRGVGGSGGSLVTTDLDTRAADACRALETLRGAFPDVERIGVIGMSEGGGIALAASRRCGPLAFAVLLSAPILDGEDVMAGQLRRALAAGMIPDDSRAAVERDALRFFELVAAPEPERNREAILELLSGPTGNAILPPYAFVPQAPEARTDFVLTPWYQSQVHYSVQEAARVASLPLLAIYGTLDQAIEPEANAELLRELVPTAEVVLIPGLNHLMQEARTGSPMEYATLPESVSAEVIERILAWFSG